MIPTFTCLICTGFTYVPTSKCLIRATFQGTKYIFRYNNKHLPCKERSCKDSSILVIFTRVEVEGAQKALVMFVFIIIPKTTKKPY